MARLIDVPPAPSLDEYEAFAFLAPVVRELRAEARQIAPSLAGRTVWMVNSTERGGGVAEMLPGITQLLRELGVRTEWVVIESRSEEFFALTKRIHNLIHGTDDPALGPADREVFEAVNRENAVEMARWVRPGDVLVVHDPQPVPLAGLLSAGTDLVCIWRSHIGLDASNERTRAAWDFLRPYAPPYRYAVFSAPEYIPDPFSTRAAVIHPGVDPLGDKNRDLSVHKIAGVLANSALAVNPGPALTSPYAHVAQRVLPSGALAPANMVEDIGLLYRPIVTQISRWDRLKGWAPLLDAFVRLKRRLHDGRGIPPLHRRRLELVRLVLAGPEAGATADDPEGNEVFAELVGACRDLDPSVQRDVALLSLPMASRRENALMVNALQRTSSLVVQNSLREGFGLTVTEAMWKGVPVLSNRLAVGPRLQIRDGLDGCLAEDPEDAEALAGLLDRMLEAADRRAVWGRSAQRRVSENFLIFQQLDRWLRLLADAVHERRPDVPPDG